MKKDESKIYKNLKKDLSLKTIVIAMSLCLGIAAIAQNIDNKKTNPAQTIEQKAKTQTAEDDEFSSEPVADDNAEENTKEALASEDDNATDDDGDEKENTVQNKEKLNEVVTEAEEFKADEEENSTEEKSEEVIVEQEKMQTPEVPTNQVSNTDENLVEVIPYNQNVEVLKVKEYESYKDRRTTHGFMMNIVTENVFFADYVSQHDQAIYEDLWGQEDVSLPQINLNYKFNFKLGSITLGAGYGQGSIVDDRIGDERTITVDKTAGSIQFLLDNMMSEPYFVPYVGASIFKFNIGEKVLSTDSSYSSESEYGNAFTVGFLIQLNWADKESAKEAYLAHGLENTYLDVFWTQHENPNEDPLPNVQSDMNWGAGLRVEF